MNDLSFEDLNEDSVEMVLSYEGNADLHQAETAPRTLDVRPVNPTFLHALGLMTIGTVETTTTSVPLSKSRATHAAKHTDGCHTSASRRRPQSKAVTISSTAKKTSVAKKIHVSKPKKQAKKRSHATSSNEPRSKPVVDVKKMRKPAAPTTDKPTTKKKLQGGKKQQRKASPPATAVSSSARKSTVKTAENLSKLTNIDDEVRFWTCILESDFKSMDYITLLMDNQFTEEQTEAIQKSFQHLSRTFCSGPLAVERLMITHQCIDCDFSMSHDCSAKNSSEYWPLPGNAPCIESITPESMTMCICSFSFFHSHISQLKPKTKSLVSRYSTSACDWVEDNHSMNLDCPQCSMRISMTNRYADVCSDVMKLNNLDGPIREKFFKYVVYNWSCLRYPPVLKEFYSCSGLCCMLFHRCDRGVMNRRSTPMQPHRPFPLCHSRKKVRSV